MNRRIERLENAIRAIECGNGAAGPTTADQAVIDAYRRDIAGWLCDDCADTDEHREAVQDGGEE